MFYDHIEIPSYVHEGKLEPVQKFDWQIIGNLRGRSKDQSYDMFANGFWADTSKYLCLLQDELTVAWLGFGRFNSGGVVFIKQLQGRPGCRILPTGWPELMLKNFLASLDRTQIHTVKMLPARLSPWWSNEKVDDINALRGRLVTYYDRVPAKIGFDLVDIENQKLFVQMAPRCNRDWGKGVPYHTLRLER